MRRMISDQAKLYASEKYERTLPLLGDKAAEISGYVEGTDGDEKILMKFLYGTMPVCDAADYGPQLIHAYVKHALFLRETKAWTKKLPEDVFFDYVLYYRVNNEDIKDCRKWFYDMLCPLLEDCGEEEAVKRVNYWCARQATYTSSDERTLGPMGVFYSGSGRCGEESTFLVTALRSVGIASRQVYTPRWAHCDDNHAWVEAWVEGGWRFLGACEPEEVLDKGWFTNASSRAMMVHTRVFSDYRSGESAENGQGREELTERDGAALFLNDTPAYARTGRLTVAVKEENGKPVSKAKVFFELLNGAEYYPVSVLETDEMGTVSLEMGLGSVQLHVSGKGCCAEKKVCNEGDTYVEVALSKKEWQHSLDQMKQDWQYIDHIAPRDYPMHPAILTKEQKEQGRKKKQEADRLRQEKLEGFLKGQEQIENPRLLEIAKLAYGNADEICRFYEEYPEEETLDFLEELAKKDYRDISKDLLEEHFTYGKQVREFAFREYLSEAECPRKLFLKYVWNPRIRYEAITPYRSFFQKVLGKEQRERFCREPKKLWQWILDHISCDEERNYHPVVTSPVGVWRTRQGSLLAKKTLFVAVCRTLGIPARINPVNQEAEYYKGQGFHEVTAQGKQEQPVCLILENGEHPSYFADWTIGRLVEEDPKAYGRFETLDFWGREFEDGVLKLMLQKGIYRLITTVRLPNGNQMEARRVIDTESFLPGVEGMPECRMKLHLRKPEISQMLEQLALDNFTLCDENGTEVEGKDLIGNSHTMLAFLEEGMEPTEHFLNELREQEQEVRQSGLQLVFVAASSEAWKNQTLADTLARLPVSVYYDEYWELPEILARRMYTDPEKLPLVLLVSPGMRGRYASSGYNVGSVGMMLRIAKLLEPISK